MAAPAKKLIDMERGELLTNCLQLIAALHRSQARLQDSLRDLPPNKRANDRHQKHKLAWGRTKKRLLDLLHDCVEHAPTELAEQITYELNHAEFLYQKRVHLRSIQNASKSNGR